MNKTSDIILKKAGFVSANHGEVMLSGVAKELFESWILFLSRLLAPYYENSILAPSSISKSVLDESGYLKHFPQQLFVARAYKNGSSINEFLTPAACLHFYSSLANVNVYKNASTFILARCARVENSKWDYPFRLSHFHMAELVVVGSAKTVDRKREEIERLLISTFKKLGLEGGFETATDAFFLGDKEGAKIIQKMKGLKHEFRVALPKGSVALASINNHEDYFAKCFEIKSDKEIAYSFCAAFGIERLTAYSLLKWGADKKKWPRELRA